MPSMSEPLLELRDVRAGYGEAVVLDGVSVALPENGSLALLGRNGVGKTTLLLTVMGFVPLARGSVRFRGEDILGFCLTSSGAATDGKWHMVLDGDTEGMPPNSTYGLWAFNTSDTYLITQGDFAVDAALGGHSEVYKFDGSSFSGPTFSAPDAGLSPKVDAIHLGISD